MSVIELATLLKQYEAACPGKDVRVRMTYDVDTDEHTATVPLLEFKWDIHGPLLIVEDVT